MECGKCYSAFTSTELGEVLPKTISEINRKCWFTSNVGDLYWACYYSDAANNTIGEIMRADTKADARAKMLIYLVENGLLHKPS